MSSLVDSINTATGIGGYSGPLTGVYSQPYFQPVGSPIAAPTGTNADTTDSGAYGSATGPYAGSSTAASGFNPSLLQAQYDTQKSIYNSQLAGLDPQQQAAQAAIGNQYQTSMNGLDVQHAQGQRDLNFAQGSVDKAKAQSLQQLKDQVASMLDSYMRQPGISDSSSGMVINRAVGQSASHNRANVLQNAGQQTQQIGNQVQDLETGYQTSHQQLDGWKQDQLNQIARDFASKRADIQNQLATADATQAQALAQQNAALTQEAIAKLQAVAAQYSQSQQSINQSYLQNAPTNPDLGALAQYSVQPISAGQLGGIQNPTPVNQSQTPDLTAPIFNRKADQFSF